MEVVDKELLKELEGIKKRIFQAIENNNKQEFENTKKDLHILEERIKKLKIKNSFEKFFLPISKLAKNEVALLNISGKENKTVSLETRKNKTLSIKINFDVDFLENEKITLPKKYTNYLDAIQMAIGSIMDCGEKYISAEQVIRVINGLTNKDRVTPEAIKETEKRFMQLRSMWVEIDRTKLLDKNSDCEIFVKKPIINFENIIKIKNQKGNLLNVYTFNELPILYSESKRVKQIRSIPTEFMNIKGLRTSEQNTAIKIWLLQQIESMKTNKKNGKHRINKINIKTLFESLKNDIQFYEKNERATKSKYIKQTLQILDYWKEKNYIKDYKQNLKNRSLQSIEIIL